MKRIFLAWSLAAAALEWAGCKTTPAPSAVIPPPNEAAVQASQPQPAKEYEYHHRLRTVSPPPQTSAKP